MTTTHRREPETQLPTSTLQAWRAALDALVEDLSAAGTDRLAMADFFIAYGALASLPSRGAVGTAERMRDLADAVERPSFDFSTGPVGRA